MKLELWDLLHPSMVDLINNEESTEKEELITATRLLGALYVSELIRGRENCISNEFGLDACDEDSLHHLLDRKIESFNDLRRRFGDSAAIVHSVNMIVTDGTCVLAKRVDGLTDQISPAMYYAQDGEVKMISQGMRRDVSGEEESDSKLLPPNQRIYTTDFGSGIHVLAK